MDGRIVECRFEDGDWVFSRYRDDKEHANHESVYLKIMQSISDGVDENTVRFFFCRSFSFICIYFFILMLLILLLTYCMVGAVADL
jgi:hypothetical protein